MRDERLEVTVAFDERRGYIGTAPQLRTPVTALSLGGLRRRIEVLLLPDDVDVVLDRLQTAAQKIDALFGADYARSHPEVLVVVMQGGRGGAAHPADTRAAAAAAMNLG